MVKQGINMGNRRQITTPCVMFRCVCVCVCVCVYFKYYFRAIIVLTNTLVGGL